MFGQGLEFGGISSADVGFTTWTHNQQLSGAGAENGNPKSLEFYSGNKWIITDWTGMYAYTKGSSTFSYANYELSGGTGINYTQGLCYNYGGNNLIMKGSGGWISVPYSGSSFGSKTTLSGPSILPGQLSYVDIGDGNGAYIYQVIYTAPTYKLNTVRRYSPSNVSSYTDISLPAGVLDAADGHKNAIMWDGVGWWIVYQYASTTWACQKFSADFSTQTVATQTLGSYGGYHIGYQFGGGAIFLSPNKVYLKASDYDKVQEFTLS